MKTTKAKLYTFLKATGCCSKVLYRCQFSAWQLVMPQVSLHNDEVLSACYHRQVSSFYSSGSHSWRKLRILRGLWLLQRLMIWLFVNTISHNSTLRSYKQCLRYHLVSHDSQGLLTGILKNIHEQEKVVRGAECS